ncbi:hypothetical protein P1P68_23850 [Streptomyces scabiei]|uniref:hypothetical protein n=1 Tax=Streptomyces scabiei TaxID=1930 RepID=UPI00298FC4B0|nr:hypothetical protein [Streptomyces scabiei]MDW8807735.1 hypothetical protein [Streptomyces scabiei]
MTGTPAELRQLLQAVLEALDIPAPATVGDTDAHHALLADRAMDAVVALQTVLKAPYDCAGWSADYLRARLAEKPPTGYRHWQDRVEETESAERAKNQCARCHRPFDSADTAFDGRARYRETPHCRRCVDNCREGSAEHVCVICDPKRYGGEPR